MGASFFELPVICPHCGKNNQLASPLDRDDENGPGEGDALLCLTCRRFGILADAAPGSCRKPTKREQRALDGDKRVQQARAAMHAIDRAGKGW